MAPETWSHQLQRFVVISEKGNGKRSSYIKQVHNVCDACVLGNIHREEFLVRVEKKKRDILELVQIDLSEPMLTK